MMDQITVIASLLVAAAAALLDLKWGRIPNWLTFPAMLLGVLYIFWQYGAGAGVERCILLLALFLTGTLSIIGMGDLKLLMALGALNGGFCLAVTALTAALLLLSVELIRHREETQKDIRAGICSLFKFRFDSSLGTGRKAKFAPYIFCGLAGGVIICIVL
ncbi:MAG: prepilin peptidase [Acutalibacter sp.]|nr:prepilin peptidase [Acutalibacter sp.]